MKKKITAVLSAISVLISQNFVCKAESIDYSDKIAEVKNLIELCEAEGYSVQYERINLSVLDMFDEYMQDDLENGVSTDSERWIYNSSVMDGLYSDTKNRLQAYLDREEKPLSAELPDMLDLTAGGTVLYGSSKKPVFSIGFGHTEKAIEDIPYFTDMGLNNLQIEIGPNRMSYTLGGWINGSTVNGGKIELSSLFKKSGESSLKLQNSSSDGYKRIFQKMEYEDGVSYEIGFWGTTNGQSPGTVFVSAADYTPDIKLESTTLWTEYSYTYKHSEEENPNPELAIVYDKVSGNNATVYMDDFYAYELDADGNRVSDNLLKNKGFETDWGYDDSISYVTDALEAAEKENIGVCLLISPHYLSVDKTSDLYTSKGVFIKYNVGAEETRTAIEEYIRNLMPYLAGYKSLTSICISNEPVFNTMNFADFYNDDFREYLLEKHGSLSGINAAYGTEYTDISELSIPTEVKAEALSYDWVEFNERVFTDWHIFMKDIIKEYLPEIPVHSKLMKYFTPRTGGIPGETEDRDILARGTDLELFDEFSDYAGIDTYDYIYSPDTYYKTMLTYDYLQSVSGKPVYNSEDHIIKNKTENFNNDQLKHWRNNLWMGAVHGRNLSTIWGWSRTTDTASDLYLGALSRPDIIAETGKTNLDLNRLSEEIVKLQKSDVALFYSKPSRLYGEGHISSMLNIYENLLNIGKRPGVVSDKSISMLDKYKVLIMPEVTNIYANTVSAIEKFVASGGKVIYYGATPSKDEYNNADIDFSYIIDNAYEYTGNDYGSGLQDLFKSWRMQRVTLIDNDTGEIPTDMDWQYYVDDNVVLVNASLLDYENEKNISIYLDGEKLDDMTELITKKKQDGEVQLDGYTPVLLEHEFMPEVESEIINLKSNACELSWEYSGNTHSGAMVYKLAETGHLKGICKVTGNKATVPECSGTYVVKAVNTFGAESDGAIISVAENITFGLELNSFIKTGNSVCCEVEVNNKTDSYAAGVVMLEFKNEEGNTVKYNYQKLTLTSGKNSTFRLSMPVPDTAVFLNISVYDSIGGRVLYSNTVNKEI